MADNEVPTRHSSEKSVIVRNSHLIDASDLTDSSLFVGVVKDVDSSSGGEEIGHGDGLKRADRNPENDFGLEGRGLDNAFELVEDRNIEDGSQTEKIVDRDEILKLENRINRENSSILGKASKTRHGLSLEQTVKPNHEISADSLQEAGANISSTPGSMGAAFQSPSLVSSPIASSINTTNLKNSPSNARTPVDSAAMQNNFKKIFLQ
ncbi:hypothetical protein L1049_010967 [Liquidambar formosana]|uniref:Uncharacterized protein n=1 Tax=Liquidambar formosana TaxID=63359 RepID=A0AAP0WZE6_LIQFO